MPDFSYISLRIIFRLKIIFKQVPQDFSFGLYELDWNIFNAHIDATFELVPHLKNVGIKSTICGPESFTPDHKPLLGNFILF